MINHNLINYNLPKISIVTPSFNSAKYIEDCIKSVLNQNYPNFEHIIIDGGSTDGTIEILKKYPHLKWISEPDEGQSDALNKGFKMASGNWILWLNSDDKLKSNCLIKYVKFINKYYNIDMFYGHVDFIDENNQKIKTIFHIPYSYHLTVLRLYIPGTSGSIFRKTILLNYPLENDFHYIMDVVWFLSYGKSIKTKLINSVLSEFRVSKDNKTGMQILYSQRPKRYIEELNLSMKYYPYYFRNTKNIFYLILRMLVKVEYYFKKIFVVIIYKVTK